MASQKKSPARQRPSTAELDEAADALTQMANDPQLISGVYNYCDRWCERCPLTARCLVFKTEQARRSRRDGAPERSDEQNQNFWDEIADSFALTLRLLQREAAKHGVDLNDPATLASVEVEEHRRRRAAAREGSALHRQAKDYWQTARKLLERLTPHVEATEDALNTEARLGIGDPQATAATITDALEVVQWYLFFIDVKLQRAIGSRVDATADDLEDVPSDADGSAKIALIAIDRSMGAWAQLREHCPGEADAILDLLVMLERIRHLAEQEFPRARDFQRPGFD